MSLVLSRIGVKITGCFHPPSMGRKSLDNSSVLLLFSFFQFSYPLLFLSLRYMSNTGFGGLVYYHNQFSFISLEF